MINELTIAGDAFTDAQITQANVFMVESVDGAELQYDTLDAVLDVTEVNPTWFRPKGKDGLLTSEKQLFGVLPIIRIITSDVSKYQYGAVVIFKHKGNLVGKFYMNHLDRVSRYNYRITCISAVGLLANGQHYGGMYSGILMPDLVKEIIGDAVPYSVSPEFDDDAVYGWLPVASRRENLHQLLFAMGASIGKDANGDIYIEPLSDEVEKGIPDSRIYMEGNVRYPDAASSISVFEHGFVNNGTADEKVTLYEGLISGERIKTPNGATVDGGLVIFDEPIHDLEPQSAIIESGVNYAVLKPAPNVKLEGRKYSHSLREVTRPDQATRALEVAENHFTVKDATLVSVANVDNVADRLMTYYASAKTVDANIVLEGEKPGDAVELTDPFGDKTQGIIRSMDITMSNVLKASCEIVSGYKPPKPGNNYQNVAVITEDQTWTPPPDTRRARFIIISGGHGGGSGYAGDSGSTDDTIGARPAHAGAGGKPGPGGAGGAIFIVTLPLVGVSSVQIKIGLGGESALPPTIGYSKGAIGAPSEIMVGGKVYTSANGTVSKTGYYDPINKKSYATIGPTGDHAGGRGSDNQGEGPEVCGYKPGYRGSTSNPGGRFSGEGGYGGGAACGSNGGRGGDGSTYVGNNYGQGTGGDGGFGGDATVPGNVGIIPGGGGQGGNGGGGGGGGGGASSYGPTQSKYGGGGIGGKGSRGGRGADGCVIIYY